MAAHKLDDDQRKQVLYWIALETRRNPRQVVTRVLHRVQKEWDIPLSRDTIQWYQRRHAEAIAELQVEIQRDRDIRKIKQLLRPIPSIA